MPDGLVVDSALDFAAHVAASGVVVGFGLSLAFWLAGYTVMSLLHYLKGGS